MPVVSHLHFFAPHRDHPFDVKLVLAQSLDALRGKHDDLATFRRAEIVSDTVNEEVVAVDNLHAERLVPFVEGFCLKPVPGANLQRNLPAIGWEPNPVRDTSDWKVLINIKYQDLKRRIDSFQRSVHLRPDLDKGNPGEPLTDAFPAGRNLKITNAWLG